MKKIIKITDLNGNDRTDGRYPLRINTTCNIQFCEIECPMILEYTSRPGYLRTSIVKKIEENKITTKNSIYYFEDIEANDEII